jgi:predicted HTH transcriptional regulator
LILLSLPYEKGIKTVKRDIAKLKEQGVIKRVGKEKGGYWEVL